MQRLIAATLVGLGFALNASTASAQPGGPKAMAFFENKIRPVLVEHCYKCHSAEIAKPKGGLRLDTRDGFVKGGESGRAFEPGKPLEALLLKALRHEGPKMPPKGKLPPAVIADFARWVAMGAPDPRDGKAVGKAPDIKAGLGHWAFRAPKKPALPSVKDGTWARTEVDRFLLARLEKEGLRPVADAGPLVLLRRLSFDLTGLPPALEDVEAIRKDGSAKALQKMAEKYLASKQFGERWGRHWLDIARYAESNGNADNTLFPHAWRYRDWVIGAFEADKPFDRFLHEQFAGDLLPSTSPEERNGLLTATGFLALTSKPRAQNNPNYLMDLVADQMEVTGAAVMGLTVGCARCHDHKYDPLPTRDYYRMAGIFASTSMLSGGAAKGAKKGGGGGLHTLTGGKDGTSVIGNAMGVREGNVRNVPIALRGESNKPGSIVPRGVPEVLENGKPLSIAAGKSGRLELAQWLTTKDHPLTSRVMVNRIWLHLFGRGIVPTPDNFGLMGEEPTHPELLDFLAVKFVEDGWSVKKMIAYLVSSRAYAMASDHDARNHGKDQGNRYFWRYPHRRLDGEALRDAVLAVSGRLDTTPPGRSFATAVPGKMGKKAPGGDNNVRVRSVYLPIVRNGVPEVLALFDFADPSLVVGTREVTIVPSQSLFLMNSPFMVENMRAFSRRVLDGADVPEAQRIDRAYKLAYGRMPSDRERERASAFLARNRTTLGSNEAAWGSLCQALLASAEFRYLD